MPALAGGFNQKQTYKSVAIKNAYSTISRMKEESQRARVNLCVFQKRTDTKTNSMEESFFL